MGLIRTLRNATHVESHTDPASLYDYTLPLLDGGELDMSTRRGLPTLIVNTASKCGFARQYPGLEALYNRYRNRGLLVIGFPSGDFGELEFSEPDEIALFCRELYEVTFPLTERMGVRWTPHPFWHDLAAQPQSGPPVWNFTKYLLDGDAHVRGWWSTNVRPETARITDAVEALLPRAGYRPGQVRAAANTGPMA